MSRAICSLCNDIMESKYRHDFVTCKCGKSFLDGGDDYIRGTMTSIPISKEYDWMTAEEFIEYLDKLDEEDKNDQERQKP